MKNHTSDKILKIALKEKPLFSDFPFLDQKINGFWNELYIIAGGSSMGKTTFLTQLAWNFVKTNKKTEVLFFSLDTPATDISIKIASQSTEIPFSYLKNLKNNNIRYDRKLKNKLIKLKKLYKKITIFDSKIKKDFSTDDIIDLISKKRESSPKTNIVIVIDQLIYIQEDANYIDKLKKAAHFFNTPIIAGCSINEECETVRPKRSNLKDLHELMSKSYVFFTLYTDFTINYETPFMEWDWDTNNTLVPISELFIHKNKIEAFTGSIFYKFYNELSLYRECLGPEIENYRNMTENISTYKKKKNKNINKPLHEND